MAQTDRQTDMSQEPRTECGPFFTTQGKKYEEISGDVSEGREALGTCENTRLLAFTFSVTASGWRRRRVSGVTSPLGLHLLVPKLRVGNSKTVVMKEQKGRVASPAKLRSCLGPLDAGKCFSPLSVGSLGTDVGK